MLNHITVMGRLTRDPEMRYTQSNLPVASFSLAVERDYKAEGSDTREVDFINCVAWRSAAEFVQKYFTKGSMAVVSGRLQMRNWEDKDGNKRIAAEVIASNIYFGESKRDKAENQASNASGGGAGDSGPQSGNGAKNSAEGFSELNDLDGELPF